MRANKPPNPPCSVRNMQHQTHSSACVNSERLTGLDKMLLRWLEIYKSNATCEVFEGISQCGKSVNKLVLNKPLRKDTTNRSRSRDIIGLRLHESKHII